MTIFNSINKTETYVELGTEKGEKYIIPASDVIFVDDESGMVSVKNTGSRKTIGLIPEEIYHKNPDEPDHYKVWGYLTDGSVYVIPENGDSTLSNDETSRYRDTMATANIGTGITVIHFSCFDAFSNLSSVTISDSVTEIKSAAFQNCRNLTTIKVGAGTKKMEGYIFNKCYALEKVIMKPMIAPQFEFRALNIKRNGTLYVPIGSTGYDEWMLNENDHFGYRGWTKVEQ